MPRRLLAIAVVLLGSLLPTALTPAMAENAAKLQDISFDDLKFDIQPAVRFDESLLPGKIKQLDGQPIRIRGVMMPSFQQKGIKSFILLMNAECQFGSTKDPVWCNVRVLLDKDQPASYTTRPITVEGKLKLDVMKGEKYDLSIYLLDDAKVTQ
jgi:hypothetical protein